MKKTLLDWHLPIMLIFGVFFGFLVPAPGKAVGQAKWVGDASIVLIFFISGLHLKTDDVAKALRTWQAGLFGVASILLLSPLLGFALVQIPLSSFEFARGLALFSAMPTTISSCIVLTGQAGGNVALAVLFSAATNVLGVFTAPFFLSAYADVGASSGGVSLEVGPLIVQLLLTILLPLLVGFAFSKVPAVARLIGGVKNTLKVASSFFLILIPYVAASRSLFFPPFPSTRPPILSSTMWKSTHAGG